MNIRALFSYTPRPESNDPSSIPSTLDAPFESALMDAVSRGAPSGTTMATRNMALYGPIVVSVNLFAQTCPRAVCLPSAYRKVIALKPLPAKASSTAETLVHSP